MVDAYAKQSLINTAASIVPFVKQGFLFIMHACFKPENHIKIGKA